MNDIAAYIATEIKTTTKTHEKSSCICCVYSSLLKRHLLKGITEKFEKSKVKQIHQVTEKTRYKHQILQKQKI